MTFDPTISALVCNKCGSIREVRTSNPEAILSISESHICRTRTKPKQQRATPLTAQPAIDKSWAGLLKRALSEQHIA